MNHSHYIHSYSCTNMNETWKSGREETERKKELTVFSFMYIFSDSTQFLLLNYSHDYLLIHSTARRFSLKTEAAQNIFHRKKHPRDILLLDHRISIGIPSSYLNNQSIENQEINKPSIDYQFIWVRQNNGKNLIWKTVSIYRYIIIIIVYASIFSHLRVCSFLAYFRYLSVQVMRTIEYN